MGQRQVLKSAAPRMEVGVFDYGAGNVHSACRAIEAVGMQATLTDDRQELADCQALLVPGVGAFAYVMQSFTQRMGPQVMREFLANDKPILGICVGMQILFEKDEENGEHLGLGLLSGRVKKLSSERLPHMGWSKVAPEAEMRMFGGMPNDWFYFVHTYARGAAPPVLDLESGLPVLTATARSGESFVAALEDGALWATQFHPEKSGQSGLKLLANWKKFIEESPR